MGPSRILFVTLTDDFGSERLVSDMGHAGAICAVLGPARSLAALCRCVEARFDLPKFLHGPARMVAVRHLLRRALSEWSPDRVVPLDDLSATLLRAPRLAARLGTGTERLLRVSLGNPDGYAASCERVALMEIAAQVGVRLPAFAAFPESDRRDDERSAPPLPVMVKRDQSSGSGGVQRIDTVAQLPAALRRAWIKGAAKAHLARICGFHRAPTPVLIQSIVAGELAMYTAACHEGRVIDGVGFRAIAQHPAKGSSTILRHCVHDEMAEAARRLVAALGCSGFVSFDFMLDAEGRAFLIEMNPRAIGSAHLGRRFGHDLVGAFLTGAVELASAPASDKAVALFPKELERDPTGNRLTADVIHDIPWREPDVLAAYVARLKMAWPAQAESIARLCGVSAAGRPAVSGQATHPEFC